MANKFNSILVKKNNELLKEERMKLFREQVKKITAKENGSKEKRNEIFIVLKNTFQFLFKILLFFLRIALILIIIGIIVIIFIGLMYPESQEQFREVTIMAWNKLIVLTKGWLN